MSFVPAGIWVCQGLPGDSSPPRGNGERCLSVKGSAGLKLGKADAAEPGALQSSDSSFPRTKFSVGEGCGEVRVL